MYYTVLYCIPLYFAKCTVPYCPVLYCTILQIYYINLISGNQCCTILDHVEDLKISSNLVEFADMLERLRVLNFMVG